MPGNSGKTVADELFRILAERGVEFLFANAGTDFSPIIEALAKAETLGTPTPRPVTVPHEAIAVYMAQGYYLMTERPQSVMVHVNVGTANALGGLINLARANIPVLMFAGRTPLVEQGLAGARDRNIQWAQEAFDQAGMLREYMKWDYELRNAVQLEDVLNRAIQVAMSEPRGPVYISLPREVLAFPAVEAPGQFPVVPSNAAPDPAYITRIAEWVRAARSPLVITSGMKRGDTGLGKFAETYGIPVLHHVPQHNALDGDHPCNIGLGPSRATIEADLILVLECDVPWIPSLETLREDCKVVHVGPDPSFESYPLRVFRSDLALRSSGALALEALSRELGKPNGPFAQDISARRERIAVLRAQMLAAAEAALNEPGLPSALVTRTLSEVSGDDCIYVSDYSLLQPYLGNLKPGQYIGMSPSGALGWGMGVALGVKLASPESLVVAGVGDGSYFFSEPLAAHHLSRAENLPTLTVIYNNRRWGAVENAVRRLHPDGYAMSSNHPPLTMLEPSPDFEKLVEVVGGAGFRVDSRDQLRPTLARAVDAVRDGRQAVVNVLVN